MRLQDSILELWRDKISGRGLRVAFFLITFLVFLVIAFYWRLPPEIPLTYSRPWGSAQLVPSWFLFFIILGFGLLVVANSLLAAKIFEAEQLLARILVWMNTLAVLLVDVSVLRIVLLVV
jgi:Ni/Fe-hydrogenase subunit HybB-like protein